MLGAPVFRTALYGPWSGNALWTAARAVPSIDLRFAESKSLTDAATGANLVTFTRASSGTYVGSNGVLQTATTNEPRFDHNPTTGESLGLLVEEQRTNGYVNSENLTGLVGSAATTAASVVVTPSANTNAISLTEDGTNAQHYTSLAVPVTSGTAVSISIFAKLGAGSRGLIIRGLAAQFTSIVDTRFDLVNGTVAAGTGSIQRFPNSWYRCTFIATPTATSAGASIRLHLTDGANVTYQGDGASSILLYGPQVENGAFPTSYIPTTGATATRSADVASITGTNFSSWYRQGEGTIYGESRQVGDVLGFIASVSDGTDNNRIAQFRQTTTLSSRCVQAGTATNPGNIAIVSSQTLVRSAIAVTASSCGVAANGVLGTDSAPSALPVVDRLGIGLSAPGATQLNGTIRRLTYWPARLPNSTLQTLTQ